MKKFSEWVKANKVDEGIGAWLGNVTGLKKYKETYYQLKDVINKEGVQSGALIGGVVVPYFNEDLIRGITTAAKKGDFTPEEASAEYSFWLEKDNAIDQELNRRTGGKTFLRRLSWTISDLVAIFKEKIS